MRKLCFFFPDYAVIVQVLPLLWNKLSQPVPKCCGLEPRSSGVVHAAWEVCWTSWPHAPPQHIVPHHVIEECPSSFVLTSTALMELRAILNTIEWSLAWHRASSFFSKVILRQDLWAASFKSLQAPLRPFKPKAGTNVMASFRPAHIQRINPLFFFCA